MKNQQTEYPASVITLLFFTGAACLALSMAGCRVFEKSKAAAETAITHYHQEYNDGQIDIIWSKANQKFHSATTREKYETFLQDLKRKLGNVTATRNLNWDGINVNFTTTLVMRQKTSFDRGEGIETFRFQLEGDDPVLIGYNIQSPDLVVH